MADREGRGQYRYLIDDLIDHMQDHGLCQKEYYQMDRTDDVMNIEPIYSLNYSKMLSINSLISTIHSVLNLLNIFAPTQNPQSYPPPPFVFFKFGRFWVNVLGLEFTIFPIWRTPDLKMNWSFCSLTLFLMRTQR